MVIRRYGYKSILENLDDDGERGRRARVGCQVARETLNCSLSSGSRGALSASTGGTATGGAAEIATSSLSTWATFKATTAAVVHPSAGVVGGSSVSRGLWAAGLDKYGLATDVVGVGSESSLVSGWGGELNKRAVLLAVNVEVDELTVGGESGAESVGLDGLGHVADVAHRALLLERGGDGLRALALGVSAGSLPALGLRGLVLLVGGWGGGDCSLGGCRSSNGSLSRGRCRRALLSGSWGCSLCGWDSWDSWHGGASGSSSGGGTVSPAHWLGWGGWNWGSLGSRGLGDSWGWDRVLGDLSSLGCLLLELLLSNLRGDGSWGSGSLLFGLNSSSRGSAVGLVILEDSRLGIKLELLVDNISDDLSLGLLDAGLGLWHLDISDVLSGWSSGLLVDSSLDNLLLGLLVDVAEDVVKDEVSSWLLGEDEGLDELLQLGRLVGGLANDLDDDGLVRALGVDVRDADLAVLELKRLDTLLDRLDESATDL